MRTKLIPLTSVSLLAMGVVVGCGASKDSTDDNNCLNGDCQDSGGGPGFDIGLDVNADGFVLQDISLDPSNATIYIDTATTPPMAATQAYKATLNLQGGGTKDVTSEIVLTLDDPKLGTFTGSTFKSVTALPGVPAGSVGGVTTIVHGTAETKQGSAALTIVQLRKTGDHRDFFFLEPYLSPPSPDRDVLKFGTNIKQVDVGFSIDTTGSMFGEIDNLKSNLSSTTVPALVTAIPSVGLAVVDFKDTSDTYTVRVDQLVTTTVSLAQTALNSLSAGGGGDEPEADIQSMYHIVTGAAVTSLGAHTPAPGTSGGVDFRAGSLPVVVNVTDAHWHDPSGAVSLTSLEGGFKSANAKFVAITIPLASDIENSANTLSDVTNSNVPPSAFGAGTTQCPTGVSGALRAPTGPGGSCRLNFLAQTDGTGVSSGIVQAIQAISVGSTFDVTAVPSNDATNAPGTDGKPVDATKFIKALRAMDEGSPKDGCPAHAAKDTNGDGVKDTFISVVVGTAVCFEVLPQENTTVPPKPSAQFFNAFIDVLGMPGSVKLDHRVVLFLVPPKDPTAR